MILEAFGSGKFALEMFQLEIKYFIFSFKYQATFAVKTPSLPFFADEYKEEEEDTSNRDRVPLSLGPMFAKWGKTGFMSDSIFHLMFGDE